MTTLRTGAPRFVVTGCGRSGTGFIAEVFRRLGYRCGHEGLFGLPSTSAVPGNLEADASWLAAPFVETLDSETVVFHQVRNPLQVVRSFLDLGFFAVRPGIVARLRHEASRRGWTRRQIPHPSYIEFVARHCSSVFEERSATRRAIRYWVDWNGMVERAASSRSRYLRYRVEDVNATMVGQMLALLGDSVPEPAVRGAVNGIPDTVNTRRLRGKGLEIRVGGSLEGELLRDARHYGYDLDPDNLHA